jgi:hypothetical protein
MMTSLALHRRAALFATASSTGCTSPGDWEITRKMRLMAACCSSASLSSALQSSAFRFDVAVRRLGAARERFDLPAISIPLLTDGFTAPE